MQKISLSALVFISLISSIGVVFAAAHLNPPQTIAHVDIKRYAGKWYEIASFPAPFQQGCEQTQTQYHLETNYIAVKNSCFKNKIYKTAEAKAFIVPNSGNAKFKVQFFWPIKADYWILYVDKDYQYALVGSPTRDYCWIIARKPNIPQRMLNTLIFKAQQQGYNISNFHLTRQI